MTSTFFRLWVRAPRTTIWPRAWVADGMSTVCSSSESRTVHGSAARSGPSTSSGQSLTDAFLVAPSVLF